jgi:hypothetical protein
MMFLWSGIVKAPGGTQNMKAFVTYNTAGQLQPNYLARAKTNTLSQGYCCVGFDIRGLAWW